jgi:hypothetical protein
MFLFLNIKPICKHIIIVIYLFNAPLLFAQCDYFNKGFSPYINYTSWQYFPVGFTTFTQTLDGGILAIGSAPDTAKRRLFVVKTDSCGDTLAMKMYGQTDEIYFSGYGGALIKTIDNNYALCGTYRKNPQQTLYSGVLIKFNEDGDTLWQKIIGDSLEQQFRAGIQTQEGYFYLAGYDTQANGNNADMWLLKADSLGNTLWSKHYGGLHYEEATHIAATNDGGFLLSGMTNSWTGGGQNYDIYIVKVDSAGNQIWDKRIGGPGSDGANIIQINPNNYFLYGGRTISSINYAYIALLDINRNIIWDKYIGDTNNEYGIWSVYFNNIDSEFILAGQYRDVLNSPNNTSGYISSYTLNGNLKWNRKYNTFSQFNYFRDIEATADGGYILAGFGMGFIEDENNNTMFSQEGWLVKTDAYG